MSLRRSSSVATLAACLVAFGATEAWAQEDTIDILAFETFDTSDEVMKIFYDALEEGISGHPEMKVVDGANVTLPDMLLTLGCTDGVETCLPTLSGVLPVNKIAFGSVQRSDDIFLFTIKMYNLDQKAFTHVIEDQTVKGDIDRLKMVVPAIIDSMLYGPVGKMTVNLAGASSAEVFFDGRKLGEAPRQFGDLPLGEHVVTVRTNGQEESRTVIVERGEPLTIDVKFDGALDDPTSGGSASNPYAVPAYATLGVGVAGLVVGALGQVQLGGQEDEAQSLYGGRDSVSPAEQADVLERRQAMNASYTQMMVGYSVGAAGLVGGAALLFLSMNQDSGEPSVAVVPTRGGGAVTFTGRF
jgi:hypothetical protein